MKRTLDILNSNMTVVLLIVISVLLGLYALERKGKYQLNRNVLILNDSIRQYKNRMGELYSQVNGYVITEEQLRDANSQLYDEVQKLKNQKPIFIVKEQVKIEYRDTMIVSGVNEIMNGNGSKTFDVKWGKETKFDKDNSISLNGSTSLVIDTALNALSSSAKIDKLDVNASIFISYTEEKDGKLNLNARTDFPGLSFTRMEGYIIDPMKTKAFKNLQSKKRFGISAFGGIGTAFDGTSIRAVPTVGVGLTYDFISF